MWARRRGKRIKLNQIVTKENAVQILEWQQSLPVEEMNSALIMECVNILASTDMPEIDVSEKERIWEAIKLHISEERVQVIFPAYPQGKTRGNRRLAARPAVVLASMLCFVVLTAGICLAAGVLPWRLSIMNDKGYFEIRIVSTTDSGIEIKDDAESELPDDFMKKLDEFGIVVAVPRDVPDSFAEWSIETSAEDEPIHYVACHFRKGDDNLTLKVEEIPDDHLDDNEYLLTYEMSGNEVNIYRNDNGEYYMYDNESHISAMWRDGNYVCSITGNASTEDITRMIDSIH